MSMASKPVAKRFQGLAASGNELQVALPTTAGKKKKQSSRLWMRVDRNGQSELLECDRHTIMGRACIPARDLRVLGPLFSQSSNIIAREKAMVINLEFVKAIITSDEVFILDPKNELVASFIEQLRIQLPLQSPGSSNAAIDGTLVMVDPKGPLWVKMDPDASDVMLPFEFRVLEIALEFVCSYLETGVTALEHIVYPALDDLTKNVSTSNLEHVRSLKSNLARTAARVQKVQDEVEHLLDDDDEMAAMFLTRKHLMQQFEETASVGDDPNPRPSTRMGTSVGLGSLADGDNVEELEMLLENCFLQIDATRNKLAALREYIDDTEDYINIELANHRNQLIQLQLILVIGGFVIAMATAVAGIFGMNIPYNNDNLHKDAFLMTTGFTSLGALILYLSIFGYAKWRGLMGT